MFETLSPLCSNFNKRAIFQTLHLLYFLGLITCGQSASYSFSQRGLFTPQTQMSITRVALIKPQNIQTTTALITRVRRHCQQQTKESNHLEVHPINGNSLSQMKTANLNLLSGGSQLTGKQCSWLITKRYRKRSHFHHAKPLRTKLTKHTRRHWGFHPDSVPDFTAKVQIRNKVQRKHLTCWGVLGNRGSVGLWSFPPEPCAAFSPLVMAERLCVRRQPYFWGCVCEAALKWLWLWLLVWARARGACLWALCVTGWIWMWLWLRVWVTAPEDGSSSFSSVTTLPLFAAIHMLLCPGTRPGGEGMNGGGQTGGAAHGDEQGTGVR